MNKKISLVLEGGGLRGAYTAGCLSWLIDEGIEFDSAYGISTGAVHLCTYLFKNKEWLFEMSTKYIPSKSNIGIGGILKEGQIVSYSHMLKNIEDKLGFKVENLKTNVKAKIGFYDLELGKTIYLPIEKIDSDLLKAACSLPLLGKITKKDGRLYLDGGISDMIPIKESINDGNTKHLVITTKPIDYTRKPAKKFVVNLMSKAYKMCPNIGHDYKIRHLNYNDQIGIIKELVDKGDAFYRYPTGEVKVTRLGGSKKDLEDLFNMGRSDMEKSREEVYKLLK